MTRPTAEEYSSDSPISKTETADADEDLTLGNISTEAQVNFELTERKSRGLPSRPHLPRFDHSLWAAKDHAPAQAQTTHQSSSNIPNIIEGIDELHNRTGMALLAPTAEDKVNMWQNMADDLATVLSGSSGKDDMKMDDRMLGEVQEQESQEKAKDQEHADGTHLEKDDQKPQFNSKGHRIKIHQETPWSAAIEYIDEPVPEFYAWAYDDNWKEEPVAGDVSNSSIAPLPTDSASQLSRKSTVAEGDSTAEGRRIWKSLMENLDESQEFSAIHEKKDQNVLIGSSIPTELGTNAPINLRVEPRIIEFQPVGVDDSNRYWCHSSHDEMAASVYMRAQLVNLENTAVSKVSAFWNPPSIDNDGERSLHPITIGDIGFMDSYGEFRTLFNVFQSQEENRRNGIIAPGTHYPCAEFSDHMAGALPRKLQRPSIYVRNAKKKTDSPPNHFSFTCDYPKDFAILVLPEGGVSRLFNKNIFMRRSAKEYFRDNVFSWYKFAKDNGHQGIKNGSLFIITATIHAPVWGMVVSRPSDPTVNKKKQKETPVYQQSGDNAYHYIWDSPYSTLLHCAGPTYDELQTTVKPINRCLAVAPCSIWLDDPTWNTHFAGNNAASLQNTANPGSSHPDVVPPSSSSSNKLSMKSLTSLFSSKHSSSATPNSPVIRDYMTLEEA